MNIESTPEKKVSDIELSSDNGLVIWRLRYEDDSVSPWESSYIENNNINHTRKLKKELEDKYLQA
jgi:hypothetical protein